MASGRKRKERRRAAKVEQPLPVEIASSVTSPLVPEYSGSGDASGCATHVLVGAVPKSYGPSILTVGDVDDHRLVKDLLIAGRAIRNEWPITSDLKQQVIDAAKKHLDSVEPKVSIAAQRVVIAADSVNQRREATVVRALKGLDESELDVTSRAHQTQVNQTQVNQFNVGIINLPANERRTCLASIVEEIRTESSFGEAVTG